VERESLVHLELTNIPLDRTIHFSLQNYALKLIKNLENSSGSSKINLDIMLQPGTYYIDLTADESFQNQFYHLQMEASPLIVGFADISNHWAKDNIIKLTDLKLIKGYDNYRFFPDQTITRAEAVALLNRAFRWQDIRAKPFSDVLKSDWYEEAITHAAAAGVISGYPDGSFKPNDNLTRMETAVLLAHAVNGQVIVTGNSSFTDIHDNEWGAAILGWMENQGLISGYPDGSFKPDRPITRAEFAQLLVKIMKY
jgi:hypothetical protein